MQHVSGDYASAEDMKAVPKLESNQDASDGVQKFCVKLPAESAGQTTVDVRCQMELGANLNAGMTSLSLESREPGKTGCSPIISSVEYLDGSDGAGMAISHAVTGIYRDDVVKSSKPENILGLGVVMEIPGDSESEDISDESDDDEGDGEGDELDDVTDDPDLHNGEQKDSGVVSKSDSLADGEIRIMWLDGTETTNNFGDIVVVDRGFLHGDLVASVTNPTGQLGLVVDVNVTVDLRSPDGEILRDVSSVDLKRIREFTVGDYVIHGPWLGRVEDVLDNVTVTFDDGAVCKVLKADPLRLKPVSKSIVDDSSFPYYPGQRVRAVSSSIFKGCRWFSGLWKANRLEGTVTKVQAGSVFVYWISSSNLAGANPDTVPPEEQNPKNLTLLSCFSHANWQLGEWCLFHPPQMASSSIDNILSDANLNSIGEVQVAGGCNSENAVNGHKNLSIVESVVSGQSDSDLRNMDFVAEQGSDVSESREMENDVDSELQAGFLDDESLENAESCCNTSLSSANNLGSCKPLMADGNEKDKGFCTTEDHDDNRDISSNLKEASREGRFNYRKKLRKVLVKRENKGHRKDDPYERAFLIVNIITRVDVAWQDGTREHSVCSNLLIPINSPGDHEFFPEQYVVEKASNEADEDSDVKRVGVVKSMDAVERTACIRWLKPVSRPEDRREFDIEEVVSAYELDEHPDYDYCYGDVVIRLSPVSTSAGPVLSESVGDNHEGDSSATHEEKESGHKTTENETDMANHETDGHESGLSWVGHITGLQDGDIEVTWADGMVSKVGPQAIYVVGRDDDGETFDGGSEYSDGASWETVEDDDTGTQITVEEESAINNNIHNKTQKDNGSANVSEAAADARNNPISSAIGFMTRLASGIFSRGKTLIDPSSTEGKNENENEASNSQDKLLGSMNEPPENLLPAESSAVVSNNRLPTAEEDRSNFEDMSAGSKSEHPGDDEADGVKIMKNNNTSLDFKHFDMTRDPVDHYFIGNGQASGARKWAKKVQQEWNILEKNLPDAIYVRTYEDRMDLLRAVIVGACGTPYQDGLFFFDLYLSPEYPQVPPTAYYHSGGLRVNPNLYEDGKVCLSLLNTWTGKGNEVWDPSSSSILQVLVSIQGLVLNSKPYFNEAGYEKQIGTVEGEKNCLPYNENTFLLNLKSMMYILRRPPMHFEDFVKNHFRRRGYYILKACDAYMKGYLVGTLTKDACLTEESHKHPCSVGFKLMLAKIIPKLCSALGEVGADCHEFEHLLKSE